MMDQNIYCQIMFLLGGESVSDSPAGNKIMGMTADEIEEVAKEYAAEYEAITEEVVAIEDFFAEKLQNDARFQ